jgi:hypothetical protein
MGLQLSYLWSQAYKASLLSLKGLSFPWLFGFALEKLDCPVLETELSNFHRFIYPNITYPFIVSLIPHLSPLKFYREGDPKTPIGDF